ncbi:RNA polymerase III transcription factor IIIC subunit-domain-containing protein [Lophiotrema nucula]|uniref:RNA polymerase III transcription factor IIIC subunit-domain-containing protein n=1 Tax=Lophiotrema nucula TaxID=690887 RepID=A0A6A5YXJ9_9PLEO|nr:RNA polymerase III transcription factor IIIC subunit-domain-containing protein [Lophiotrema nucula]
MDVDMDTGNSQNGSKLAETLQVPPRAVSLVEHPCIIKNIDKGIASLGGSTRLSQALRARQEQEQEQDPDTEGDAVDGSISLSLRPGDPFAKRLASTPVPTNSLLLKVTVPRRTGRKRKRGTNGPFLTEDELNGSSNGASTDGGPANSSNVFVDATTVYRSLKDNASRYEVAPVGVIDETHRYRNLPDLQWAASQDESMRNVRDSLLGLKFKNMKDFSFDSNPGPQLSRPIGPPAEFLQMPVAYNYHYQQNHFVKYNAGRQSEHNTVVRLVAKGNWFIKITADTVPITPKPHLPPENTLSPVVQAVIASVRAELAKRPIITRHLLYNRIGWDKRDHIRDACVYCGYFFETGPWREALIVWGLDPRKDSVFRQYQTISFQSYTRTKTTGHFNNLNELIKRLKTKSAHELSREHIFDGTQVSSTGNLFQFCDITDPLLRRILDTPDIRETCAPTFQGWYHVGTWAKATVILRDKMQTIIRDKQPDDSLYARIMTWPELWTDEEMRATYIPETLKRASDAVQRHEWELMGLIRDAARNPRYAFEKMETKNETENAGEIEDDGMATPQSEPEVAEDVSEEPDRVDVEVEEEETAGQTLGQEIDDQSGDESNEDDGNGAEDEEDLGQWANDEGSDSDGPNEDESVEAELADTTQAPRPFGGLFK